MAEQAKLEAAEQARAEAEEQAKVDERAKAEQQAKAVEQAKVDTRTKAWAINNLRPEGRIDEVKSGAKVATEPIKPEEQGAALAKGKNNSQPDVRLKLDKVPASITQPPSSN
jgi:hypothetical protein